MGDISIFWFSNSNFLNSSYNSFNSNDSISEGFSYSSSNSERNSINEMEGNIKKSDETSAFIDSKYDIQKDI